MLWTPPSPTMHGYAWPQPFQGVACANAAPALPALPHSCGDGLRVHMDCLLLVHAGSSTLPPPVLEGLGVDAAVVTGSTGKQELTFHATAGPGSAIPLLHK